MKKLTTAEEEIMQVIWEKQKCLLSDIIDFLGKQDAPTSTISSIVRILVKKGFIDYKAYGRTYEYYPLISKKDYTDASLHTFVNSYFDGSMKNLVSFLIEAKDLDTKELNDLLKHYKREEE
ncbi:MAG: BlaI/MecI/CopY family transcriptional regulator [Saprospiraceae bacterium]|nr:BlaI/MecI/CopY family transcriptional regulator [Saprospiraceae bacterium]